MSGVARDPLYRRHRFPVEVIAQAVWLYFRFPPNLCMVEDMLAARGVIVTHQTVRSWAEKFGQHFARKIKRRSVGRFGDKWHLDKCLVALNGQRHRSHKGLNNRAENSHQPTRRRERIMKRFKSPRQLQRFVSIRDPIANLFHLPRNTLSSAEHRDLRNVAMQIWREIACVAAA